MRQYLKLLFLLVSGGLMYNVLELAFRGWTHWTMFLLGGLCFICIGAINEIIPWEMPLWQQVLIGAGIITGLEFATGCIINVWLGWTIWDYSQMPGNIMGQVCPQFFILWLPVALVGIVMDDCLRYRIFHEDHPHYNVGLTRISDKVLWLSI